MPVTRCFRFTARLVLGLLLAAASAARAEESPVPLAPIGPRAAPAPDRVSQPRGEPRIDPVRPARLTAAERDRLYAQVERDAELLERQSAQLRRLTQLVRPTVVHKIGRAHV